MNENLYKLIRSCWKEDGRFSLPATQFPAGSPAAQLIAGHFPSSTIELAQASEPKQDGANVIIERSVAVADLLGYKSVPVKFRFYSNPGGDLHFEMHFIETTKRFRFDERFPSTGKLSNWGYLALTDVELKLTTLFLTNRAGTELQKRYAPERFSPEQEKKVVKGWEISGVPGLPEEWDWVYTLLGDRNMFRLKGPLEIFEGHPRFLLATQLYNPVEIGHLKPQFAFEMLGWFAEYALSDKEIIFPEFSFRFRAQLAKPLEESEKPVTLFAHWGIAAPVELNFAIDAMLSINGALKGLDRLFNLQQGEGLATLLPKENFPLVTDIELKTIEFSVSLQTLLPKRITVRMGLAENASFVIFPEIVRAKGIDLIGNMIFGPGMKPFMDLSARAAIEFTAGSQTVVLNNSFELPSLGYSIGLDPMSTVNLSAVMSDLFPSLGKLPAVWATSLSCSGKIKPPQLFFESAFETEIEVEWIYLKLQQFGISFFASRPGGKTDIEAEAYLHLLLADRVNVNLSGRISKTQLSVSGEIATTKKIKLPEILPKGIDLPEQFEKWDFDRGSISIKRGAQNEIMFTLKGRVGFEFGDLGNMWGDELSVTITQKEDKKWAVKIAAKGEISLFRLTAQKGKNWLVDIKGTVVLYVESLSKWELSFEAAGNSGTIGPVHLPIPKKIIDGKITPSEVTVQPKKVKLELNGKEWSFDVESIFKLDTFAFLNDLIPETGIAAFLAIKKNTEGVIEAQIGIRSPIGFTTRIRFPERENMSALDLGLTRFELSSATISVSTRMKLEFTAVVSWYLPQYLNEMFGIEGKPEEHRPRFRFFKTYKPEGNVPGDALSMSFTIGVNSKLEPSGSVELHSIPLSIIEPSAKGFVLSFGPETDKGKYGKIEFDKPKLAYNAIKGFEIALGFTIIKDPALPLTPMIKFLERSGLGHLAKWLPDPLPIPLSNPPRFFHNNGFNWELLRNLFKDCGQERYFEDMRTALRPIEERFAKLPDALKDYLQPPALHGFTFNLKVSPTGNVEAGFEMKQKEGVKPDDPSSKKTSLQLLLVPGIPVVFFGIRLRKFSFGQLFGGQLLTVLFDADVDVFDIGSIGASLIDDPNILYYIGNPKEYTRNIQLYDMRMFIIWQTQIPLIIPAFYRKFGIDYYGFGDVRFQSSFGFPEPEFDISKLGLMLGNLVKFLKDPNAPMPEDADYKPMDLTFSMGPLYLETGKWMGSKVIGWKTPITPRGGVTLSSMLARILNTIKFFSLNKFIRNIPYDNRHAEAELVSGFLGMSLAGKFLLSTPYEFIKTEWKDWGLLEQQRTDLVSIVSGTGGKPVTPETDGIVLFLRGKWNSKFGSLDASFGMIALDSKNFAIGFRFDGQLANAIMINSAASVTIRPTGVPFTFSGSSTAELKLAGMVFFSGKINASGNSSRFAFDGEIKLTEPGQTFNINGNAAVKGHFEQNSFSIAGAAAASFLIFQGHGSFEVNGVSQTSANGKLILDVAGAFGLNATFNLNKEGFTLDTWAYLFTIFNTRFIARLHSPSKSIHFLLRSEPAGGLFGFTLDFKATFGNNVNQKGEFYIDLAPHLIPNARIFRGDCTFLDNGGGQTSFSLYGNIDLHAFKTTLTGNFRHNGFLLSGGIELPGVIKLTIYITHQGIGFELKILNFNPAGASLKGCNNTLYLCGVVDGREFYVDLQKLYEPKLKPCPCGQKKFRPCDHPESNHLFLLAAAMHHNLFREDRIKKQASVTSKADERYEVRVTRIDKTSQLASFSVRRKNLKADFFTELKRDAVRAADEGIWKRHISLTDAHVEAVADLDQLISGTIELNLYFPKSPNPECRVMTTTISYDKPQQAGMLLARQLKAFERKRLPVSKQKAKAKKHSAGKSSEQNKTTPVKKRVSKLKSKAKLVKRPVKKGETVVKKKPVKKQSAKKSITRRKK